MSGVLILFSSEIERVAAFPFGEPAGARIGIAGVGLVDAGIGAARLIDRFDPSCVIFAGTCGAHSGSGVERGEIVLASHVRLGSGDVSRGAMRIPTLLPSVITVDSVLNAHFASLLPESIVPALVDCSCTLGITEQEELATRLRDHDGSDVENLELFSILRAAGTIPAIGLMGVTNIVGPQGGSQWRESYRPMMRMVGDALRQGLEHGTGIFAPNDFTKQPI